MSFSEYQVTGQAVNGTITLDLPANITIRPHVFVGATFTDNDGLAATPGAGTISFSAETLNNPGVFTPLYLGTSLDATAALNTLSAAGNLTRIQVVTADITVATLVNVKVTANGS